MILRGVPLEIVLAGQMILECQFLLSVAAQVAVMFFNNYLTKKS
jgi:hypothetical protein